MTSEGPSHLPAETCLVSLRVIGLFALLVITLSAAIILTRPASQPDPALQQSANTILHAPLLPVIAPDCPTMRADPSFGISLMDARTGAPICERNPGGIAQPASTTKIMAVLLTAQYLQARHLSLDTPIIAQAVDKQVEYDAAVAYLQVGQRYSVRALLYMISMLSAADAVMALARFVSGSRSAFLALMNQEARRLGMLHTRYTSPYGYASTPSSNWQQGESASVGNYSSAHDMALLMRAFAQYPNIVPIFGATTYHQGGYWLDRASGYIITDSWLGLSTSDGVPGHNLHLPFTVLAVKKGCMWCNETLHKTSYVLLAREGQQTIAAAFLYTGQSYGNPLVGDMLPTLLWAFHQCHQPAYAGYC